MKATHGESRGRRRSPEYSAHHRMRQCCYNQNNPKFKDYGGRGIRVCARWLGPDGLANFLKDMGRRPSLHHSLDRIDVNGHYEPSNCRWATLVQQANNKRRSNNSTVAIDPVIRSEIRILAKKAGLTVTEMTHSLLKQALQADALTQRYACVQEQ